jgi:hypothetical protein
MAGRGIKVIEEDWDYLIILDACRYDYFAGMAENYFTGRLQEGISLGFGTLEWLKKNFTSYYPDVIYVSGNPYCNSKMEVSGFDAKQHFYRVVDVWEFGWDENLGTVPPEKITQAALEAIKRFAEKKFIIHYLQPHAPYISQRFFRGGFPLPFTQDGILSGVRGYRDSKVVKKLTDLLGALLIKAKLIRNTWELRERLGLPPASPMDAIRRKCGVEGLKEAYQENLQIVLEYVAELCRQITTISKGKIVITADHGELLGEDGRFSHGSQHRLLLEVPWFEIESIKKVPATVEALESFALSAHQAEKEKVGERIRKLREAGRF